MTPITNAPFLFTDLKYAVRVVPEINLSVTDKWENSHADLHNEANVRVFGDKKKISQRHISSNWSTT